MKGSVFAKGTGIGEGLCICEWDRYLRRGPVFVKGIGLCGGIGICERIGNCEGDLSL